MSHGLWNNHMSLNVLRGGNGEAAFLLPHPDHTPLAENIRLHPTSATQPPQTHKPDHTHIHARECMHACPPARQPTHPPTHRLLSPSGPSSIRAETSKSKFGQRWYAATAAAAASSCRSLLAAGEPRPWWWMSTARASGPRTERQLQPTRRFCRGPPTHPSAHVNTCSTCTCSTCKQTSPLTQNTPALLPSCPPALLPSCPPALLPSCPPALLPS